MTNPNHTLIAALLDRSGSMATIKADSEGGYDTLIAEQRAQALGTVDVTLAQFDDAYDVVYRNVPISEVPPLTLEPRGSTALLDGIGRLVTELGAELAGRPEHLRPGKVIVVIITDGGENSSRRYSWATVRSLIETQQSIYGWTFIFLGANIDAVETARHVGIPMASAMTYGANAMGTRNAYAAVSNLVTDTRSGLAGAGFTEAERAEALSE